MRASVREVNSGKLSRSERSAPHAAGPWSAAEYVLLVEALLVTVIGGYVALRFADQPLLERHGFRQTQTALTSFWFLRDGPAIAYETPVGGAPWAIPFEAPIYQLLVSAITALTRAPLARVGRVLSWLFLLASLVPTFAIGRRLSLGRSVVLVFITLWLSAPLYLFWGRSFMIETAALFFLLAALPFGLDLVNGDTRFRCVIGATAFMSLAMLQKITTAAPAVLVLGALWLVQRGARERGFGGVAIREWILAAVALGSPVLIGFSWSEYSDVLKASNAFGSQMTAAALRGWELGSVGQRLSSELYLDVIWRRVMTENAGGLAGAALIAGASVFARDSRGRRVVLLSLLLFVLPLLLFTNLHIVHDYYQTSCALFVIAALAVAVGAWLPGLLGHPFLAPVVTALLVASNLVHFAGGYWGTVNLRFPMLATRTLELGEVLKRYTPPDSAFVAFGYDWSSELAYYAERKSFTVPTWFSHYEKAWLAPETYLGGTKLGAIVGCPTEKGPSREQLMHRFESERVWSLVSVHDCLILLRHGTNR